MAYQIEYNFQTGDSFGSEDVTERFSAKWEDLEIAKENLRRIKEHYDYYRANNGYRPSHSKKSLEKYNREASRKDWFVQQYDFCLILKMDDGTPLQISAPWCGYFEKLYGAKIVLEQFHIDPDMEISF